MTDPMLAFVAEPHGCPDVEIRVNFGLFAGREATPAELDDLAAALLPATGEVTIVSEQRHELSTDAEASLHQVRVEVDVSALADRPDRETLVERLLETCNGWARRTIDERHIEV
jgi:hypothetical protein